MSQVIGNIHDTSPSFKKVHSDGVAKRVDVSRNWLQVFLIATTC